MSDDPDNNGGSVPRLWDMTWAPYVSTPDNTDNQTIEGRRRRRRMVDWNHHQSLLKDTPIKSNDKNKHDYDDDNNNNMPNARRDVTGIIEDLESQIGWFITR